MEVNSPINARITPAYKMPVALCVLGIFSVRQVNSASINVPSNPDAHRNPINIHHAIEDSSVEPMCRDKPTADTIVRAAMAATINNTSRFNGTRCMVGVFRYQCPKNIADSVTPNNSPLDIKSRKISVAIQPVVFIGE